MNDPGPVPEPRVVSWKSEASLWHYMEQGQKTWDARFWDLADDRYNDLMMSDPKPNIRFENKETGQILAFELNDWMFGPDIGKPYNRYLSFWMFLYLGRRVHRLERHDADHCDSNPGCLDGPSVRAAIGRDKAFQEWDLEYPGQPCMAHAVRCGLPLPEGGFCPDPLPGPQGHRCG